MVILGFTYRFSNSNSADKSHSLGDGALGQFSVSCTVCDAWAASGVNKGEGETTQGYESKTSSELISKYFVMIWIIVCL